MRVAQIGILGVGLALAGFGVYMAQTYVGQTQAALAAAQSRQASVVSVQTVPVLVATRALRYGELIGTSDVQLVDWPATAIPPGAFQTIEALIPDLSRLDWRQWPVYGAEPDLEFLAWSVVMAVSYAAIAIVLGVRALQKREFS